MDMLGLPAIHACPIRSNRKRGIAATASRLIRVRAAPDAASSHLLPALLAAIAAILAGTFLVAPAFAGDWSNAGGNAGRNGLSDEVGPTAADLAWSEGRTSLIAWLPVTEGDRMFTVRQARWPNQQPNDAYVVATDLIDGHELWAVVLPYNTGDWTPWIAGVRDGKVYCSRSGNGASVSAVMYALDVTDGHTVWVSDDMQDAGPYDGTVFAPDGDLLIGSFEDIWRFDAEDGHTVWHAARVGSVSSSCGGARHGNAFYVADAAGGGHILVRYDVETGERMHQSQVMPGFTLQNTPMVAPDGTIYLNRAQNNPAVDFYYAFTDDGTQFIQKWRVAGMGGAFSEYGVGPDGSVYVVIEGPRLARLDPLDGRVIDKTAVLSGYTAAHIAIDADGKVFLSNSAFGTGRLYAYDADLTPRWDVAVTNINIGGPALGAHGTLVVCGVGTDVRAYRSTDPADVPWDDDPLAWDDRDGVGGDRGRSGPGQSIQLVAAGPNPFIESTDIRFRLAQPGPVSLEIVDAGGRCVRTLLSQSSCDAGEQVVRWLGDGRASEPMPAGVYYYRILSGGDVRSGRIVRSR
jgi:hypothetical protein